MTKRVAETPPVMTSGEAARRLGMLPIVFGFACMVAGIKRPAVGTTLYLTPESLKQLRTFMEKTDPGRQYWTPVSNQGDD